MLILLKKICFQFIFKLCQYYLFLNFVLDNICDTFYNNIFILYWINTKMYEWIVRVKFNTNFPTNAYTLHFILLYILGRDLQAAIKLILKVESDFYKYKSCWNRTLCDHFLIIKKTIIGFAIANGWRILKVTQKNLLAKNFISFSY